MDLDVPALRWAKAENLERLLRAPRVPLPDRGVDAGLYHRRLVRATWLAMDHDRRQAAAEEQRMKDEEARRKVAAEIAAALSETGERPRAQIARIVALMGAEWTRDVLQEALKVDNTPILPINWRSDGQHRTFGGVFFAMARARASLDVLSGGITRRDFFRCFFDRPAKPRPVVERPVPIGKVRVSQLSAGPSHFRTEPGVVAVMNGNHEIENVPGVVKHTTRSGKGPVGRLHEKRKPVAPVVEYVASRRRSG